MPCGRIGSALVNASGTASCPETFVPSLSDGHDAARREEILRCSRGEPRRPSRAASAGVVATAGESCVDDVAAGARRRTMAYESADRRACPSRDRSHGGNSTINETSVRDSAATRSTSLLRSLGSMVILVIGLSMATNARFAIVGADKRR